MDPTSALFALLGAIGIGVWIVRMRRKERERLERHRFDEEPTHRHDGFDRWPPIFGVGPASGGGDGGS